MERQKIIKHFRIEEDIFTQTVFLNGDKVEIADINGNVLMTIASSGHVSGDVIPTGALYLDRVGHWYFKAYENDTVVLTDFESIFEAERYVFKYLVTLGGHK